MSEWNIARARDIYSIKHWSDGYFDINEAGHLVASPRRSNGGTIDVYELVDEMHQAGLSLPVLLRFTDILHDRVTDLCQAFEAAIGQHAYQGRFCAVYPIKVKQQRHVIDEVLSTFDAPAADSGLPRVGLEAGSKPELMIVLAQAGSRGATIICNGYKDREYIRLALIGRRLGYRIHLVVEKLSELELIIREAQAMGIKPMLGMRARLTSIGKGNWQNTGGEKSKFGLSSSQMLAMLRRLREAGLLDCLQLLHVHLGSQIANLRDIRAGMQEAMRCYADLVKLGAPLASLDVGGGLGVDYEGTRSRSYCSMNYSLQDYADSIVSIVTELCNEGRLPHPDIITESGRAMTAHHAVLVTNVIDVELQPEQVPEAEADDEVPVIRDLRACLADDGRRTVTERYHDAVYGLTQARELFTQGRLTLAQRGLAEQIYFAICHRLRPLLQSASRAHHELLDGINDQLADKVFCNFSLFQSLPDVWAIEQVFPIVPLHRLDTRPERRAVITDITCDSDGRIDHYVDNEGVEASLPLHDWHTDQPYLLGIFMVGAYQEILGDCHNLFGDTNSANVELLADGSHRLYAQRAGDSVDSVLRAVDFDVIELTAIYRQQVEGSRLSTVEQQQYLEELVAGLEGYTYLED